MRLWTEFVMVKNNSYADNPTVSMDTKRRSCTEFYQPLSSLIRAYKGPLLSIIQHISELNTPPALLNPKIYKSNITKAIKTIQYQRNEEE